MKLTLLGVYGPFPAAGGGCSSYLVEDGDTKILLDCGSGSYSRMLQRIAFRDLDAIVLSHLHADHTGEIDLFRYALEFGQGRAPLKVLAPETRTLQREVFEPIRTEPGMRIKIGTLSLTFFATKHAVVTNGVRITDAKGSTLVYTGDSAWTDSLVDAAKDADLLLADACLADESNAKALNNHMTGAQVIALGKQAGCRRVILTHRFGAAPVYPIPTDAAYARFAEEGAVYEI